MLANTRMANATKFVKLIVDFIGFIHLRRATIDIQCAGFPVNLCIDQTTYTLRSEICLMILRVKCGTFTMRWRMQLLLFICFNCRFCITHPWIWLSLVQRGQRPKEQRITNSYFISWMNINWWNNGIAQETVIRNTAIRNGHSHSGVRCEFRRDSLHMEWRISRKAIVSFPSSIYLDSIKLIIAIHFRFMEHDKFPLALAKNARILVKSCQKLSHWPNGIFHWPLDDKPPNEIEQFVSVRAKPFWRILIN